MVAYSGGVETLSASARAWRGSLRWGRRIVYLIVGVWLLQHAAIRWSTPPAAQARLASGFAAAERVEFIRSAIRLLPPVPVPQQTTRVWGGMTWTQLLSALNGPWEPESRSDVALAAQYVTSQAVEAVFKRIEGETATLVSDVRSAVTASRSMSIMNFNFECGHAVAALSVRARRSSAVGEMDAAIADLVMALRIAAIEPVMRSEFVRYEAFANIAMFELTCLVRENLLTPRQADGLIALFTDELGLSVERAMLDVIGGRGQFEALLDRYYTDDGAGGGWLVLAGEQPVTSMLLGSSAGPRGPAWNLLSPLFHDRARVRRRLEYTASAYAGMDSLPYEVAQQRVDRSRRRPELLDGPISSSMVHVDPSEFYKLYGEVARRRACVVMIALSAYRGKHGVYPARLEELAPDDLPEVPHDAFSAGPLDYSRTGDHAYRLRTTSIQAPAMWWWAGFRFGGREYTVSRDAAGPESASGAMSAE